MRIRPVLAIALLLPSISFAQARPRGIGGGSRPGQPVPLGAQPEVIARATAVQRSKYAVEAYPLISRVQAPGFMPGSPVSSWTSYGTGTRLDYRLTQYLSWTADLTTSYLGGPALSETAELGLRLKPQYWDHAIRPFADVRFGFEHSSNTFSTFSTGSDIGIGPASGAATASRYSKGFGGIAGAGAEYSLTNTIALTSGLSVMRANMVSYRFSGISAPNSDNSYRMTSYRLTLGLKYNPVHMLKLTNEKVP